MTLNDAEYFYVRNGQGDIIGLIDNSGAEVATYTYDSWGKLISIKDQLGNDVTNDTTHIGYINPYRYRGYRYDLETGLYYLQSRYYNPEWGRFVNQDGIVGAFGGILSNNMFAYSYNNPVNYSDPSGYHAVIEDAIAYGGGGGGIGLWAWILGVVSNPVAQEAGVLYAQQGPQITEGAKNTGEKLKELAGGNGGSGSNPDPNKFNNGKGNSIKNVYDSIKKSPNYPDGFKAVKNGTTKNTVKYKELLEQLRQVESGTWKKIYKDGYDAYGNKFSIHYFQSQSGKVFNVKVKFGWSNF